MGAALAPNGTKVAWVTNVVDGGGGAFQWFADYGGGWNGPRTGDAAGYGDASYIHVAFGTGAYANQMLLHVQLTGGTAPNWTFTGGTGAIDLGSSNAATFATQLAAPSASDPVISTDDVAIDPATNDAHLFARTKSGAALSFHRTAGGTWSAPLFSIASSLRARLVFAGTTLFVAYGPGGKGLAWREATTRTAGQPVDWNALPEHVAALPAGYANVQAIYPESSVYQSAAVSGLRLGVVGDAVENEALFVSIDP